MITLRKRDWDDKQYDGCGNTAIAILEIDNITIPLCAECVNDLTEQLNEYNNTIFCYKCPEFVMGAYGWNYGGSCKKKAAQQGITLTDNLIGYNCFVDCLDTCKEVAYVK